MAKAFVDTTILVDVLLSGGEKGASAKRALATFSSTELPVYAIKEFKAGPLSNFIWMHNKLVQHSLAEAFNALHAMSRSPRRYRTSTAIQALQQAFEETTSTTLGRLAAEYGQKATVSEIIRRRLRLSLKTAILRAWKKRRKVTSSVVNELSCYAETAPIEEHNGRLDALPIRCERALECCMAPALKGRQEDLRRLLESLRSQDDKRENLRRRQVLRNIIRKPKDKIGEEDCRNLGDAIFVLYAPSDSVILTTNLGDFGPLAEAIGKRVTAPIPPSE